MSIAIYDIPETQEALGKWLDQKLMSCELGQLIAELKFIADEFNPEGLQPESLNALLGQERDAVLTGGLAALRHSRLCALLTFPELLLELQELVLVEGGEHWQDQICDVPMGSLSEFLQEDELQADAPRIVNFLEPVAEQVSQPPRRKGRLLAPMLSAAALVLIGVVALQYPDLWKQGQVQVAEGPDGPQDPSHEQPVMLASTWGWDSPDALNNDLSASEYLLSLSNSAKAWFNKKPDTQEGVHQRLAEFRHGCETLLNAPHTPLTEADRAWLIEKCKNWAKELDTLVSAANQDDPLEVRGKADELIDRLGRVLAEKANELA
ncbi:MAG: hypothetical protein KDA78_05160 [Planctomycetaceae bacterium]|nr:hypothetical protein [Planctomycetaceae bacterium]